MIASAAGGVEIEEVAAKTPEKIVKVHIDPLLGLRDYQARDIAASIDLPRDNWKEFGRIRCRRCGASTARTMPPWPRSIHW